MRAVALLVLLVGCVGVEPWSGHRARPELDGLPAEMLPAWRLTIEQSLGTWEWRMNGNDLRRVDCPMPIEVTDDVDACPVRLVAPELWTHGDRDGVEDDCYIEIKGQDPNRGALLVHEFGHAIGLEHNNDPASIMHSHVTTNTPTAADVLDARAALGCD